MSSFVALDLETANSNYASICEIGLTRFEKGEAVASWSSYIAPPDNLFFFENTWIHGIQEEDCEEAPFFDEIFGEIREFIGGLPVVSHNTGFDFAAIRKTCDFLGVPYPELDYFCTLVLSRKALQGKLVSYRLQKLTDYFSIPFEQEHRAEEDSLAAGLVALKLLDFVGVGSISELAETLGVRMGKTGPNIDVRCEVIQTWKPAVPLSAEEKSRLVALQKDVLGVDELDPSLDFYGKKVALTGALQSLTRQKAKAILESVGAVVTDSVSKNTSYVIQGAQKPEEIAAGGSRKEKQAEKLLAAGVEIEVIQEADFLRLLMS